MAAGVAAVVGMAAVASVAAGDPADGARVDWAAGRVTASGIGIADRHAPSPAVALGTSRRAAEQAARAKLAAKLPELPLAAGGTLADRLADTAIKARVAAAVEAALTVEAEPETDGSWRVQLAVPVEAVRQALAGPRTLAGADDAPPVIVIDRVTAKPAVGWRIGDVDAATLWVKDVPAWAKAAPRKHARSSANGAITVDGATVGPSTLVILVGS